MPALYPYETTFSNQFAPSTQNNGYPTYAEYKVLPIDHLSASAPNHCPGHHPQFRLHRLSLPQYMIFLTLTALSAPLPSMPPASSRWLSNLRYCADPVRLRRRPLPRCLRPSRISAKICKKNIMDDICITL